MVGYKPHRSKLEGSLYPYYFPPGYNGWILQIYILCTYAQCNWKYKFMDDFWFGFA